MHISAGVCIIKDTKFDEDGSGSWRLTLMVKTEGAGVFLL